ncbi:MAG: FAD-binding protein [Lachnospiraceae bacterium]|nr:FAD-binding protein [Lachnospiraceae bacterium]
MANGQFSRREFLNGTGAWITGFSVTGLLGGAAVASASEAEETSEQSFFTYADTIVWGAEYDVVVLGMGFSGMVAAKYAADAGAGVLIVEKMPEAQAGGNSKVCGQCVANGYDDADNALTYYKALTGGRDVPEAVLKAIADGVADSANMLSNDFGFDSSEFVDCKTIPIADTYTPEYPEFEGGDKVTMIVIHNGTGDGFLYSNVKQCILDQADQIDIWYDSPANELIQDPVSGAIIGVKVTRNGEERNVRALNGVVVCTGGFEDDAEMVQHYLNLTNYAPMGGLYNTGDGIKMCQKVGADLWHMNTYEGGFGLGATSFYVDEGEVASNIEYLTQGPLNTGALVLVGTDGERFVNECELPRHGHFYENGLWENPKYPEKLFVIFDQTQYDLIQEAGSVPERFQDDILSFDSIAEMAEGTGCDEERLTQTIEDFNFFAESGRDYKCGREADLMRAFDGEKYYAIQLKADLLNTQGGPKRNENAEILDTDGNPIPHLYSAGEMGGFTAMMYQGGTNVAECFIFGKIAGQNAAAAKDELPVYENAVPVESTPLTLGEDTDVVLESTEYDTAENEYIGTGSGINGDVVVKVAIIDGVIESVEVLEQNETEGIGSNAIDQMPSQFIGMSSEEEIDGVDGVSGATVTSNALKEAVKDALSQYAAAD